MNKMWNYIKDWFIEMGSPPLFFKWSSKMLPWLVFTTIIIFTLGLTWGLFYSPTDYKQGDVYRIIYIHVPSAILGQSIFMFMAVCGFITMVWRVKISGMLLKAAAPTGASRMISKAEEILMDELPIIPIYTYTRVYMLRNEVKGWYPNMLDTHPYQFISLED